MFGRFNYKDYNKIHSAALKSLQHAFANPHLEEPKLIANMVWHLPRQVNKLILSGGISVRCGGVFTHSQPYVSSDAFPDSSLGSVEIGDLLLLHTALRRGQVEDRRAMLLQAKKADHWPVPIDNQNQHYLYEEWPTFEYVRSTSALNGKRRFVRGKDLRNASKYLLAVLGGARLVKHLKMRDMILIVVSMAIAL
jgi:hypothetical protein